MDNEHSIEITLDKGVMLLIAEILRQERGLSVRDYDAAAQAVGDAIRGLSTAPEDLGGDHA